MGFRDVLSLAGGWTALDGARLPGRALGARRRRTCSSVLRHEIGALHRHEVTGRHVDDARVRACAPRSGRRARARRCRARRTGSARAWSRARRASRASKSPRPLEDRRLDRARARELDAAVRVRREPELGVEIERARIPVREDRSTRPGRRAPRRGWRRPARRLRARATRSRFSPRARGAAAKKAGDGQHRVDEHQPLEERGLVGRGHHQRGAAERVTERRARRRPPCSAASARATATASSPKRAPGVALGVRRSGFDDSPWPRASMRDHAEVRGAARSATRSQSPAQKPFAWWSSASGPSPPQSSSAISTPELEHGVGAASTSSSTGRGV